MFYETAVFVILLLVVTETADFVIIKIQLRIICLLIVEITFRNNTIRYVLYRVLNFLYRVLRPHC